MAAPEKTSKAPPRPDGRVRIVPSLLAADFGALREAASGFEWVSVDVMDGHFVPNLSFGPDHVAALRKGSNRLMDAHLMVSDPAAYAPLFADAGADWVTFHIEACPRPEALIRELKSRGVGVGLAVKPKTPVSAVEPYLKSLDLALVMTVEPGFGGQKFMADQMPKVKRLRELIDAENPGCWLQVDGGVGPGSAEAAAAAGADSLVAGSSVYKSKDPAAAARSLAAAAQKAFDSRTIG